MVDKQGLGNTCGRAQRASTRHSACRVPDLGDTYKLPLGVSMLEDTNISPNCEKEALTQNWPRDLI